MLNQPTYDKLVKMRLSSMADAYRQQAEDTAVANLSGPGIITVSSEISTRQPSTSLMLR